MDLTWLFLTMRHYAPGFLLYHQDHTFRCSRLGAAKGRFDLAADMADNNVIYNQTQKSLHGKNKNMAPARWYNFAFEPQFLHVSYFYLESFA